jgi:hypothetical protein
MLKQQSPDDQARVRESFGIVIGNFECVATVPLAANKELVQKAGDLGLAVFCAAGPNTSGLYCTAVLDEERVSRVVDWIKSVAISKTDVILETPKRNSQESQMGKCKSAQTQMGIPISGTPCANNASFHVRIDDGLDNLRNHPFCTPCFDDLLRLFRNMEDRIEQVSSFTYILRVT